MPDSKPSPAYPPLPLAPIQPPRQTSGPAHHISDRSRLSISHLSGEPTFQPQQPSRPYSPPPPPSPHRHLSSTSNTLPPLINHTSTMLSAGTPPSMAHDINYTRTGRISKAKKGLKVHHCKCGRVCPSPPSPYYLFQTCHLISCPLCDQSCLPALPRLWSLSLLT